MVDGEVTMMRRRWKKCKSQFQFLIHLANIRKLLSIKYEKLSLHDSEELFAKIKELENWLLKIGADNGEDDDD
jgi:hypothetical protein